MTPFSPARTAMNPAGTASGANFQAVFVDDGMDAYDVGEIGVFSGSTLFAIASASLQRMASCSARRQALPCLRGSQGCTPGQTSLR